MNRETERHFAELPEMYRPRSKFVRPHGHRTTFNAGDLVPIFLDQDVLPGDTIKMDMASVVRMSTPLFPTMDNIALDVMFFAVPHRLLWQHWRQFWGENSNAWYQSVEYEIPQLKTDTDKTFEEFSLADYFGLPLATTGLSVNALPFRAYVKIWNDWFRDENLQQEAPNVDTDSDVYYDSTYAYKGGTLLKANKIHDYFTSALPAPLKNGSEVLLPLGTQAPVYTGANLVPEVQGATVYNLYWMKNDRSNMAQNKDYAIRARTNELQVEKKGHTIGISSNPSESPAVTLIPGNLWTDLSQATAATISQLRQAFAVQRFYEAQARGGSRYIEFIKNIFGVTSPDARLQRSEYLGGKRIPINIYTAVQNSGTTETSPLGQTGAFSHTADGGTFFTKSFTEHSIVIGLAVVRQTSRSYNQGIERGWSRKKWYDFYVPQFAHLSEQPIKLKEIWATGESTDEDVFGYQEAWAEYRYAPSLNTASFRTTVTDTLDAWHYGDHYTEKPVLGSTWIAENKDNIDRTLAVTSAVSNQFIGDFYFKPTYVRPMPMYSVPGLIDHL